LSERLLNQISARLRNIFSIGDLQKRYDDGTVQVKTIFGKVLEGKEAFPYGYKAKAKKGKVLILCQGGNFDSFEFLPALNYEGGPDLEDGDVSLYTSEGGWVVCREKGTVELFGKNLGGVVKVEELQDQLAKLTARVDEIINALNNSPTAANDGGATYKGAITVALATITEKEDFSGIASDKVFHGTG
jgi:phage gp45-like